MNFILILLLTILPLAYGHIVHTDYVQPSYKFIFDHGFLLSDTSLIDSFDFEHTADGLAFSIYHSKTIGLMDNMIVKAGKIANLSFVIESLPRSFNDDPEGRMCSDSNLHHLIKKCKGKMRLRELNQEEKEQVKEEMLNLKKLDTVVKIKVIYDKDNMWTQSLNLKKLHIEVDKIFDVMRIEATVDESNTSFISINSRPEKLVEQTFVVESYCGAHKCHETTLKHLKVYCDGQVILREATAKELS